MILNSARASAVSPPPCSRCQPLRARTAWAASAIAFRVECNVPDATLWVDDVLVGKVTDWKSDGKQIRAGFHRIEVRHPNYYSFFQEVEVPGGSHVVVNAKLRELIE